MYCPRCGQQQISDETKFCSRCGFQMGLIPELLTNNGFFPRLAEIDKKKSPKYFTRKNGLVFSSLWFIFWVMMVPAFFGIMDGPEEIIAIAASFGLFTTVMFLIISLAFLQKPEKRVRYAPLELRPSQNPSLYAPSNAGALPPQQSVPVTAYESPRAGAWRDTNELTKTPGSVTEGTTKLLQKDE